MAKEASFDNLIQAIQQAFIRVNAMSEEQHVTKLKEYFYDDGRPKTFDMQYPYFNEDGVPAYRMVSIPQICLVPISSLKLDKVEVDFKVQLYGKVSLTKTDEVADNSSSANAMQLKSGAKNNTFLGYVPHGGVFRNKEENYASIKLKFVSQEPPEGLMRIRDQFVKVTV